MAKNNAIDNRSAYLTIDPGSSGDSFVQFDINATGEFRIGVDDTDDSFRISQGSALGTNDTFIMTDVGRNTMPLQPAFFAQLTADQLNITGNGATATINFTNEILDQNNDYDGTNTFTAPVTGIYKFVYHINPSNLDATSTEARVNIVTTGYTYQGPILNIGNVREITFDSFVIGIAVAAVDMTAGDTAHCTLMIDGMAGDTVDMEASNTQSLFMGSLDV